MNDKRKLLITFDRPDYKYVQALVTMPDGKFHIDAPNDELSELLGAKAGNCQTLDQLAQSLSPGQFGHWELTKLEIIQDEKDRFDGLLDAAINNEDDPWED